MVPAAWRQRELWRTSTDAYTPQVPHVTCVRLAYNTVYLIETQDSRVLVDTGPDYHGASGALAAALPALPDLVVATHGHLDHAGLGGWWQGTGVPVALHQQDAHFAAGHQMDEDETARMVDFVRGLGAPSDVESAAIEGLRQRQRWAWESAQTPGYRPAGRDSRWPTGLRYETFEPRRWLAGAADEVVPGIHVLHMPGHTPGNCVLWIPDEQWLFSGDQLLPDITPTPAIQGARMAGAGWRFRSLPEFVQSLRTIRALGAVRCFPGHGGPFDDVDSVIDENLSQIAQRSERLLETVRDGGVTVYSLAHELYPRALRRRFWQIIATVQGHLDLLEDQGLLQNDRGRWMRT